METVLLKKVKRIGYNGIEPTSATIEYMHGRKDEDGVYHTRLLYSIGIKVSLNGDVSVEQYLNSMPHCHSGPARFIYSDDDGEPCNERYYLNGEKCIDREDWLNRRTEESDEPFEEMLEEIFQEMGM